MIDLVVIHSSMVTQLQGKDSFRGVPIVSLDDQEYAGKLEKALSDKLHGIAVAVGNPSGVGAGSNVPGGYFDAMIRVYVFENQNTNRGRPLAATVADEEARLALVGVPAGARVHQADVNADFWLLEAGQEADVDKWAAQLTATGLLQLVIRSFQLWTPDGNQAFVCDGFDPGTIDELHDYVARFKLKLGLDPIPVA